MEGGPAGFRTTTWRPKGSDKLPSDDAQFGALAANHARTDPGVREMASLVVPGSDNANRAPFIIGPVIDLG
jgi:hypothetical protein